MYLNSSRFLCKIIILNSLLFNFLVGVSKTLPITSIPTPVSNPELRFTENKGQWAAFIKTKAEIPGGEMYLSGNAFYYHFIDYNRIHQITHEHTANKSISGTWLKVDFLNADKNANLQYANPYPDPQNYFYGKDEANWHSNVYAYSTVAIPNLYPNIDLKLYSSGQNMKYDLVAKPNAELSKIQIQYSGYKSLKLVNKSLQIETNQCGMTELKPYASQQIDGRKIEIACDYVLNGDILSFKIGKNYNANYDLVIDPQIVFSSFTGSKADNFGYTATYDQDGNTYVGGIVYNYAGTDNEPFFPVDSFPVSPGAYQSTFRGGISDVAIFKFSKDGKRRQYATYLGGSDTDIPQSMIVNSSNQLVVFGSTSSPDFPKTEGTIVTTGSGISFENHANDLVFAGGSHVYLSILTETGSALVASTPIYTNGNSGINYQDFIIDLTVTGLPLYYNFGDEARGEVICDKNDNIIVASSILSDQFALDTNIKDFKINMDAWVFKMSGDLKNFKFNKRIIGSGTDAAFGIQPDSKGNLFVAGHTNSNDLGTNLPGLNKTNQGQLDGYVAKMDSIGNLLACTYLGTESDDQAFFVQTNISDEVFVMGQTWSNNYTVVGNGIANLYADKGSGQFIYKLDNNLTSTGFSTVFGSKKNGPDISPTAFLVDNCGLIYISGWQGNLQEPGTASVGRDLPIAPPTTVSGGTSGSGFYFAVFNKNMQGIKYGNYFSPGSIDHVDGGTSRFDKRGYIYQAICGGCYKFDGSVQTQTTPDVWGPENKSFNCNEVAVKFDFETVDLKAQFTSIPPVKNDTIRITVGQPINFNFTGTLPNEANVSWEFLNYPGPKDIATLSSIASWTSDSFTFPDYMILRKMQLKVVNVTSEDCIQTDFQTFYVAVDPIINTTNICNGDTGQISILGKLGRVVWSPTEGLSDPTVVNPKVFITNDTTYSIFAISADGSYSQTYKAKVKVVDLVASADFFFQSDSSGPVPLTVLLQDNSNAYTGDHLWKMGDGITTLSGTNPAFTYDKIGKYNVQLKLTNRDQGCAAKDSVSKTVFVLPRINEIAYCPENPEGQFTISGGSLCLWNNNGKLVSDCIPQLSILGKNLLDKNVSVYSEPNKPYSYIFTLTGKAKAFSATVFDYTYTTIAGLDVAQVEFTSLTPVASQVWNVGNGNQVFTNSPFQANYNSSGNFPISITGIDLNGCTFNSLTNLEIKLLTIPNIITPNGDNINDAFEIIGLSPNSATVEVFNRWGSKVYESGAFNYANNWKADGLSDGLYYFTINLKNLADKTYKGWLQVAR